MKINGDERVMFEQAGEGTGGGGSATPVEGPITTPGVAAQPVDPMSQVPDLDSLFNHQPFPNGVDPDPQPSVPAQSTPPIQVSTPGVETQQQIVPATPVAVIGQPPQVAPDSAIPGQPLVPPVPVPAQVSPEVLALQQQVQMLLQQQQPPQQQTQLTPEQQVAMQQPPQPQFQFEVGAEVMQALDSEDALTRSQGIQAMMQQVATTVYSQTMQQNDAILAAIPDMMQQHTAQAQQMEAIRNDFYTNNADLNRPELHEFVFSMAKQVQTETGMQQWSPTMRDMVAAKVRAAIGAPAPAPAVVPQVPAPGQVPGQVPAPVGYPAVPQTPPPAMVSTQQGAGGVRVETQTQESLMNDFF